MFLPPYILNSIHGHLWAERIVDGRLTKVPVQVNGQNAKSNDPSTHVPMAEAMRVWATRPAWASGLAVSLGFEAQLAGVDFDLPAELKNSPTTDPAEIRRRRSLILGRNHGEFTVAQWVEKIGGFAEWSVNNGIKIYVPNCPAPDFKWTNSAGLECYFEGRFFAITGDVLSVGIPNITEVYDLVSTIKKASPTPPTTSTSPRNSSSDTPYGLAGLARECDDLARSAPGGRNHALNRVAFSVGTLVGGGELLEATARAALEDASRVCGLAAEEPSVTRSTLERSLAAGMASPRTAPERPRINPTRPRLIFALCDGCGMGMPHELTTGGVSRCLFCATTGKGS